MSSRTFRILTLLGTRPEAIKLAPVVQALARDPAFDSRVCVTAQHRELLDTALSTFGLRPDVDLDLMRPRQGVTTFVANALKTLGPVLAESAPDLVIVQGDTSTAFVAALAAFYQKVPVAHVEAGLRTQRKYAPFPEEMNRRLTDALSDFCFAPTEHAARNLLNEGVPSHRVWMTGNTVVDALQQLLKGGAATKLERLELGFDPTRSRYLLVTAHRRENFGSGIDNVCEALVTLTQRHPHLHVVFPVHPNPDVSGAVCSRLKGVPRIHLLSPLSYPQLVRVMQGAFLVLTDSGGLQEEAPALGVPLLVLREVSERPEGVEAGVAQLVGTHAATIVRATETLLSDARAHRAMGAGADLYGDGRAAERIVDILKRELVLMKTR